VALNALKLLHVLPNLLGLLLGLAGQLIRPGGLVFGCLRLLVGLFGVLLGVLGALVGLLGLVLRLLCLLSRRVGLALRVLRPGVGLAGFVLGLLGLLRDLRALIGRLHRGLVGLGGLVLRLPCLILRLLGVAAGLLGLLARTAGLLLGYIDPVLDPGHVLTDVLPGGQLPQRTTVLIPASILAPSLFGDLTWLWCHLTDSFLVRSRLGVSLGIEPALDSAHVSTPART
jgi:hypothetical protein